MKIAFKVEGKKFHADCDFTQNNSFRVRSVPRPYEVIWDEETNPSASISNLIAKGSKTHLLIDNKIYDLYCKNLQIDESMVLRIEATEDFKTLNGVVTLIDFLDRNQFTKVETLVVVGGGIIQDVGAFVGACFKRGIPWVYLPTTLLAMCDSCIGGKTGINHHNAKNQIALFSAPWGVIINAGFLKTLDQKNTKSGLGEILKLHITGGKVFLKSYLSHIHAALSGDLSAYKQLICGALSVKKAIVEEDEFEFNYRKALNYGHTIGHTLEVLSDFRIPHGQAVLIGMIIVNELGRRKGIFSLAENEYLKRLSFELLDERMLKEMQIMPVLGLENLLKKDKKTLGDLLNFVVLKSIGDMKFLPLRLNSALIEEITDIIKSEFNR